ncbi:MAG: Ig-like domain-containing protein [Thermoanaerobaculia bacterium]
MIGTTVVLLAGLTLPACDRDNPIAPSGTVLTVTASPSSIDEGQISTLTVTAIRSDGNPAAGATVTLSTDLGAVSTTSITLDSAGRGTATYMASGGPGTAEIEAATGGATASVTIEVRSLQPQIAVSPESVEHDHQRSSSDCPDPITPRISVRNLGSGALSFEIVDDLPAWLQTTVTSGPVPGTFRLRFTCDVDPGDLDLMHTVTVRGVDPGHGTPPATEATIDVLVRVRD